MTESSQRKSGAILSYFSIIINMVIQLLYTPLLIKMLGQSEYGLYSLISSIIGYLTVLDMGFGNALIVYTAKYRAQGKIEEEKKLHGMFFLIFCIIGVIAGILGLILYFNVENIFGATMTSGEIAKAKVMMLILAFNLAITFPFTIYSSIISAYEKFTFQKIMSILNTSLKPLLMLPLLFLGFKSITMTIVITVVNIFVLLSNFFYCRNKLKIRIKYLGFDKALFKTIFSYSFFIFLGVVVDKVNWNVDQFILGAISGTAAVSVYSVAAQLNSLFINLSTAVSGVMLPKMSKMVATKATSSEITDEFVKIGRIQYIIIFLMASGLVIFGQLFIQIWVGKEFADAYYIALLLILPLCIPLIQNLGLSIMQAMNKYKFRTIAMFIMSLFNIIISIFLAKKYGAIGAALGTGISLIIVNVIIINIYYHKVIKIDIIKFWKEILKMTPPMLISALVIGILTKVLKMHSFFGFIIFGGLYVLIYSIAVYKFSINDYEKNLVNKFLKKIKLIKG